MKEDYKRLRTQVTQILAGEGTIEEKRRRVSFAFDHAASKFVDITEPAFLETEPLRRVPGSKVEWSEHHHIPPHPGGDTEFGEHVSLGMQTGTVLSYSRTSILGTWVALIVRDEDEQTVEKSVEELTFL